MMQQTSALSLNDIEQSHPAAVAIALRSGGDFRIAVDPLSGRNKYGVPPAPAEEEIWFSSSTASAISPLGFDAASAAYERLFASDASHGLAPGRWFDNLRARIAALSGCQGTQVILCASGTETEILALTLSRHLLRRPLTNIVVATQETGVGVMHAAAGTHFDSTAALQPGVEKGTPLQGWEHEAIQAVKVDIRDANGQLRSLDDVDQAIRDEVSRALRSGRDVQLHVLDTSKTGRGGPSRAAAKAIVAADPSRVMVVVDACQLRCSFEDIQADLESGFMVMITGSKFAGGPPFCGALLIPPALADRLEDLEAPAGLAAYSARFDWPKRLRVALRGSEYTPFNLGLGLRWEAALAEIEAHVAIRPELRKRIASAFGDHVRELVAARPHLRFLDPDAPYLGRMPTIHSIVSGDGNPARTSALHKALRAPIIASGAGKAGEALARICHFGQPVAIGDCAALRVCIGMPTIRSIAQRLDRMPIQSAYLPVAQELDIAFRKWDVLEQRAG
jgi:hypothetical protein